MPARGLTVESGCYRTGNARWLENESAENYRDGSTRSFQASATVAAYRTFCSATKMFWQILLGNGRWLRFGLCVVQICGPYQRRRNAWTNILCTDVSCKLGLFHQLRGLLARAA